MTDLIDSMEEMADWRKDFWVYNLALQMWPNQGGGARILNYMPRRERCVELETPVIAADLPAFCRNNAKVLRNLADLFDAMAEGKIDTIYYPDETVEAAIAKRKEEEANDD